MLGAAAQRKFDKQAVDLVAHQLREQINALDEKSIAVREKWHQKAQYSDEKCCASFPRKHSRICYLSGPADAVAGRARAKRRYAL